MRVLVSIKNGKSKEKYRLTGLLEKFQSKEIQEVQEIVSIWEKNNHLPREREFSIGISENIGTDEAIVIE